jgi:hypothetical protein
MCAAGPIEEDEGLGRRGAVWVQCEGPIAPDPSPLNTRERGDESFDRGIHYGE